jgi:hypothetical protein
MASDDKDNGTAPTALQTTTVAATKPKLIIGGSFVLLIIVILLEIYAPRDKKGSSEPTVQSNAYSAPALIKDTSLDKHPATIDGNSQSNQEIKTDEPVESAPQADN